jgi:hypothetical protein
MEALMSTEFLRVFRLRREYCRSLVELSQKQMKCIAEDNYTDLLDLLGRKQRLLGSLSELGNTRSDLWTHWKEHRDNLDNQTRQECESVLEETEHTLAELIETESASTEQLVDRRNDTQRKLQTIAQATQVHDAYQEAHSIPTHHRLDLDQ